MVCTADDLLGWKDFPRGLKVLLLDEDINSSAEIKLKLEEMGYIVSTFYNENEALSAISNEPESFHIAIVEVSTGASHGSFTFLENAKDLPTIMISNVHCLSTMMKCIALGAAEFLQKPLSEDKLRNIWQHVVHKAFNAGGSVISKSLNPNKETIACILELQSRTRKSENEKMFETENEAKGYSCDHEQSVVSDRFPEPSTPQLKQGERLLDDGEFQDQPNSSIEKESGELEGESKSVEITCNDSVAEVTLMVDPSSRPGEALIKEEDDSIDGSKTGSNASCHLQNKPKVVDSGLEAGNLKKASPHPKPYGTKANRKKMKVDWTPELHKRFVKAVEQLGVDQAIPSRILELMKVEGLTRHNVASHLQKYRMHRRHILPKEEDRRWQHQRNPMQRNYPNKPLMPFPPYHSNHGLPTSQMYPVWGHPSSHPSGMQMWGHPGFPTWQPPESWYWNTYQGMQADAWGCPVMPPPQAPFSTFPQVLLTADIKIHAYMDHAFHSFDTTEDRSSLLMSSFDLHPADEVLDKVVKEAISQPWLPLPLGLKPPSIEGVLDELHRQGVSDIIINSSSC